MKPKPEFETPFEDSIAEFEMAPLPVEWRDELIDNAVFASTGRKTTPFLTYRIFAFGALAACWVATATLHFTTPRDSEFSADAISRYSEIEPDDLPVLMAYLVRGRAVDVNL